MLRSQKRGRVQWIAEETGGFATRSNWLALQSLPSLRKMVKVLKT